MKFRFFAAVQATAEFVIVANHTLLVRPMQWVRAKAWLNAAAANLAACNERQAERTPFN